MKVIVYPGVPFIFQDIATFYSSFFIFFPVISIRVFMKIETGKRIELIDITDHVRKRVKESNVQNGICVVSTRHTTTAIIVNENEAGLREDILSLLERLVPENEGYLHDRIDNNAHAHLKAVMLGSSETLQVTESNLVLGTWQSVFLAELDGPRTRIVDIVVIGK